MTSTPSQLLLRVLVVAGLVAWGGAVWGECPRGATPADATPREGAKKEALERFRVARERYRAGDFSGAVALLEEAYALYPEPVLIYNLGRSYEGLGDFAKAADAYECYLSIDAGAGDRGAIERKIETFRRREEPPPSNAPPVDEPTEPSWIPWSIAGVGLAALGVGVGLGVTAVARNDAAIDEPDALLSEELHHEASDLSIAANVLYVGGGVLIGGGVLWGILDLTLPPSNPDRRSAGVSTSVRLLVRPTSLQVTGTF